jgi:aminoglycoside/choline kinase family phosphotransferase
MTLHLYPQNRAAEPGEGCAGMTAPSIAWADPARAAAFDGWLAAAARQHRLQAGTLRPASADASFRRYFRVDGAEGEGSFIVMDAPPAQEDCKPFVKVAGLMADAGLKAPRVLAWDESLGFMLLSDLGARTMMEVIAPPADFMPRNLMAPTLPAARGSLPPEGAAPPRGGPAAGLLMAGHPPGVLDFQDAVYGPITYDIASLMRDAFLSWEENFVLDITIRYWERARKAGLPVGDDFGEFYRGVEWMGLQRHLKVAGIFARLTLRDGKPKYLADTPRFIAYIRATTGRYNELRPLMRLIDEIEGTTPATGFAYGRM